jgi:hypothetical protein
LSVASGQRGHNEKSQNIKRAAHGITMKEKIDSETRSRANITILAASFGAAIDHETKGLSTRQPKHAHTPIAPTPPWPTVAY